MTEIETKYLMLEVNLGDAVEKAVAKDIDAAVERFINGRLISLWIREGVLNIGFGFHDDPCGDFEIFVPFLDLIKEAKEVRDNEEILLIAEQLRNIADYLSE